MKSFTAGINPIVVVHHGIGVIHSTVKFPVVHISNHSNNQILKLLFNHTNGESQIIRTLNPNSGHIRRNHHDNCHDLRDNLLLGSYYRLDGRKSHGHYAVHGMV